MSKETLTSKSWILQAELASFAGAALVGVVLIGNILAQRSANSLKQDQSVSAASLEVDELKLAPFGKLDAAEPPVLSAKAVYALDVQSGKVVFSKDENEPILPASTTKIATAVVALAHYMPDQVLRVGKILRNGQRMGLVEGEEITVEHLLYGVLVSSASDAAETLAANYPGGRGNFVNAMNLLIGQLGLVHTHFTNPVGFDEYLHFSSARDMTTLAIHAVENPTFAKIVATEKFNAISADGLIAHKLANTNILVGKVPGVLGVKTGQTESSGESVITLIERDGHKVVVSLMNSSDRFTETQALLDWIFANYEWK